MTREQAKCETCRFYNKNEGASGECRVNPPIASEGGRRGKWPHVFTTDWCGQHRGFFKVVNTPMGAMMKQVDSKEEEGE